jgi:Ca2+-binding RTX toxin-like protein
LVSNNGSILGDVQLYIGNDIFDGSLGVIGGTIFGYAGDDILTGGLGGERIEGGFGNDVVTGNGGIDILLGEGGNDSLFGGAGADELFGGDGDDRISFDFADTVIDGGLGTDTLVVDATGSIVVTPLSFEALEFVSGSGLTLTGSQFRNGLANNTTVSGTGSLTVNMDVGVNFLSQNFVFSGSGVTVTVNGTSGIDVMKLGRASHIVDAGGGNDQIRGGTAADTIIGGDGNDKIIGFTGADVITGGTGADQFRYMFDTDSGTGANADRITDYEIGVDRLNFSLLDTNLGLAGVQGFAFVGNGAFSGGGAASIRYQNSGADLLVQCDVNGDGISDMEIILQGRAGGTLTGADFIL